MFGKLIESKSRTSRRKLRGNSWPRLAWKMTVKMEVGGFASQTLNPTWTNCRREPVKKIKSGKIRHIALSASADHFPPL